MTSSKYSISAVHRITGKSRTTIAKHIERGRLSAEVDEGGNKLIDAAELLRVYGDECKFDREEGRSDHFGSTAANDSATQHDLTQVQQQLDREVTERTRERQHYREQVEQLQESLRLAQEGLNRTTLLLEDQSKRGGEWEKRLEERIAAQELKLQAEIRLFKKKAIRKIRQYQEALEQEQSKTFWQKLLSG